MLGKIFIILLWGAFQLTVADGNSALNKDDAVLTEIGKNATSPIISEESLGPLNTINISSKTPLIPTSLPSTDEPKAVVSAKTDDVLSSNVTIIKSDGAQNSSSGSGSLLVKSEKANTVVMEGGSNVKTLELSGTNFEGVHGNPSKTVVAEGGVLEAAGERVKTSSTAVPVHPELDPYTAVIEGISSMNEGKVIARKGVTLENNTNGNSEVPKTGEIIKNVSLQNGNSSLTRKPKPAITDDGDESIGDYIRKMDYIIPIVCTVFSVPLLIVLAIYLYKRGADLWERRHYNRMDFLIEGMYNE